VLPLELAQGQEVRAERLLELGDVQAQVLEGDGLAGLGLLDDGSRLRVQGDVRRVAAIHPDLDLLFELRRALVGGRVVHPVGVVDLVVQHRLEARGLLRLERPEDAHFSSASPSAIVVAPAGAGDEDERGRQDEPSRAMHPVSLLWCGVTK
jgi:hypothetical protein